MMNDDTIKTEAERNDEAPLREENTITNITTDVMVEVEQPTTDPTGTDSIHYHHHHHHHHSANNGETNDQESSHGNIITSIPSLDSTEKEHEDPQNMKGKDVPQEGERTSLCSSNEEDIAPPYDNDDAMENNQDMEQITSQDINTDQSCDSEMNKSIQTSGIGIMNDRMSQLMRTWSHDENGIVQKDSKDGNMDDKKIPNFQPGDHVIRWKMIKVMLYPIQIHGIVLSVEKDESNCTKVVIADFGMSSSQARKKNGLETMNKTMNNAVYETTKAMNNLFGVGGPKKSQRYDESELDREFEASMKDIKSASDDDDMRFHIRTITSPDDLRKWSKVNYGQSLFSSKGKLDKLKKIFTFPQKKEDDANASKAITTNEDLSSSFYDEDDEFFQSPDGNLEPVSEAAHGSENENKHDDVKTDKKLAPTTFSKSPTKAPARSRKNEKIPASVAITTTHNADNLTNSDIKTLEQMIAEANDIDRKQRSRRIFRGKGKQSFDDMSTSSTASSMSLSSHFSNLRPSLSINRIRGEAGNIMKKLSFSRPKTPSDNTDDTKADEDSESGPKLPKSDHRSIVLARVRFILAEQDKKESESCLPPYHIFYSNSECIAVWCKTGKFCTLQAAVFLHSTAICNVKSTVMLTAGVAATQPWLIPVVGVYGIVAIGMPYMILNKCQKKWKNSEQTLTDGFWANADNEVVVTAIEQWSNLCPEKRVNTDEVGMN